MVSRYHSDHLVTTTHLLQTGAASSCAARGTDKTASRPGHFFVPFICIVASLAFTLVELPELSVSSKTLASPPPPSLP